MFLALVFGAGVVAGTRLDRALDADRCLDAGGAWDTARGLCRGLP